MVGIVLVSHSAALAEATKEFVQAMTGTELPLAVAAGAGENHAELGTDAVQIAEAMRSVMGDDGVLVLMDIGSALLSAEMALDLLEDQAMRSRIRFCAAPLVEGALAAGVTAKLGQSLEQVAQEAEQALHPKQQHLQEEQMPTEDAGPDEPPTDAVSAVLTVPNPHGLHARPAARFVQESGRFEAEVRVENVTRQRGPVSARSLSALAALEVTRGQQVRVSASGPQAQEAIASLSALVESGLGDPVEPAESAAPAAEVAPLAVQQEQQGRAQPVSEGIAIGPAVFPSEPVLAEPAPLPRVAADPAGEKARLRTALAAARAALLRQKEQAARSASADVADIFAAQALLLDDPVLVERAEELVMGERADAAWAWQTSYQELAARYRSFTDEYLRQRATDVVDVGRRVLAELGVKSGAEAPLPADREGILVVDDLTPTQASQLAGSRLSGVICLDGGRTSHSAILLRALGVPSVAQARAALVESMRKPRGTLQLALDGTSGQTWIDPDQRQLVELRARHEAWRAQRAKHLAAVGEPAVTSDGHRLELLANVGQLADAEAATRYGAEGIGLLRTEFLFLDRVAAPSEEEQLASLVPIARRMGDRTVTIRTLDVGGDKPLGYLGLPREANPFLGVRGLRLCLRWPALFQTQLRAVLRLAANHPRVRIMFPMVSEVAELERAREELEAAHAGLVHAGVPHGWPISTGIMIEVPSAALLADELAPRSDFVSIGSNDLTQYTLAADRGNAEVGNLHDALHPAVLRLVRQVVEAAHRHGKHVGVCGEAAGDVTAALVLAGLGVDELSMTPPSIPAVKAAIRGTGFRSLEELTRAALRDDRSAPEVRRRMAQLPATAAAS